MTPSGPAASPQRLPGLCGIAPDTQRVSIIKIKSFVRPVSATWLLLLSSVFLVASANGTFFSKVAEVYPLQAANLGFLTSLAVFTTALLVLVMALFSLLLPVRLVVSLFIALSAPIAYVAASFGAIIDDAMIQNILETDTAEAFDLLSLRFLLRILLIGILPVALVWFWPLKPAPVLQRLRHRSMLAAGAFATLLVCVVSFGTGYADFFREHKPLRFYANPVYAVYSIGSYFTEQVFAGKVQTFASVLPEAKLHLEIGHRELIIMVVGETARADRFSLNGYERNTNPRLANESGLISYTNVSACGTSTAVSVPCMFVPEGRAEFTRNSVYANENLLDVLQRAGVNVLWRDNNSGSKGVAERVPFEAFSSPDVNPVCDEECRDVGLLSGLQEYIDSVDGDILIVLHQMGSHGPAYFRRYPAEFEQYTPACHSADLNDCDQVEIQNAYDNTILYTDYFLSEVIALLKRNTPAFETAMLYVSDHGESLGERGIYLHGLPYMFAPHEQTKVPLILWAGSTSDIDINSAIRKKDLPHSHDSIFNSMLATFEIEETLPGMPYSLYDVVGNNG